MESSDDMAIVKALSRKTYAVLSAFLWLVFSGGNSLQHLENGPSTACLLAMFKGERQSTQCVARIQFKPYTILRPHVVLYNDPENTNYELIP